MKKTRVAVIGINGMGKWHAKAYGNNERCELAALIDINEEALIESSKDFNVKQVKDYRDLLKSDLIDAVSICTPHSTHKEIATDCLNAGLHVLIEKPLTTKISDARKIVSIAKNKNLKLAVCHQYRTFRLYQIIKNLIDSKEIGNVMNLVLTYSNFRPNIYYKEKPWLRSWRESGGGLVINQLIHQLDLLHSFLGEPLELTSIVGNQMKSSNVEDIASISILFRNGSIATLNSTLNATGDYNSLHIFGEEGVIIVNNIDDSFKDKERSVLLGKYKKNIRKLSLTAKDSHENPELSWVKGNIVDKNKRYISSRIPDSRISNLINKIIKKIKTKNNPHWIKWNEPRLVKAIVDNFISSINENNPLTVSGEESLFSLEMANAIIFSALKKKTVTFPFESGEYDNLFEELISEKITI